MKHALIICFLILTPAYLLAHPNHSRKEIGEKEAGELSWALVENLVKREKIELSCLKAEIKNIAMKKSWYIFSGLLHFIMKTKKIRQKNIFMFFSVYTGNIGELTISESNGINWFMMGSIFFNHR